MQQEEPAVGLGGDILGSLLKIKVRHRGFDTKKWAKKVSQTDFYSILEEYGRIGVEALRSNTPVLSGETANSWAYEIEKSTDNNYILRWTNSHVERGINIALILQMGHGTGTGGWVEGRDYINPAIQPIFDEMADKLWGEVTSE